MDSSGTADRKAGGPVGPKTMTKTDLNEAFEQTSFLYGGNAPFIEQLYARFSGEPASVDSDWRHSSRPGGRQRRRRRAAGARPGSGRLAEAANGDSSPRSTATGARSRAERRQDRQAEGRAKALRRRPPRCARRPSIRSARSMMIRAYRMRGHLAADLDPLRLKRVRRRIRNSIRPPTASREDDLDRPIFIDNVLGLETRTIRQIVDILQAHLLLDARRRVHAYLRSRARRPGSRSASRARTRRSASPPKASAPSSTS